MLILITKFCFLLYSLEHQEPLARVVIEPKIYKIVHKSRFYYIFCSLISGHASTAPLMVAQSRLRGGVVFFFFPEMFNVQDRAFERRED